MIRALLLALAATPATAQDRPPALQSLLDYHQAACTAQGGSLTLPDDAVSQAILTDSMDPAFILDSSKLSCSTAPAMFCAEGIGCEINVFQSGAQHSLIVLDWSVVNDEDRQLLQVTISGELLNKPEPGTYRMAWDETTKALVTLPGS
jgi:hypothetical protein